MSFNKVLVWTQPGVMTFNLSTALAHATGNEDVKWLTEGLDLETPDAQTKSALHQQLVQRLATPALLIHDTTSLDSKTNELLAQHAAENGFRHLFVYYRQDARRMVARMSARKHLANLDLDTLIQRSRHAVESLAALRHQVEQRGGPNFMLAVEDLEGPAPSVRQQQLLSWLGMGQPSDALLAAFQVARETLPNLRPAADDEHALSLWEELAWKPGVESDYAWLRSQLQHHDAAQDHVAMFRINVPSYVPANRALVIKGALRLQPDAGTGWSLELEAGEETHAVAWGGASPQGSKAAFSSEAVAVRGGTPMRLVLVAPNGRRAPLASVSWSGPASDPVPGIVLGAHALGYMPVPKAACTSLKQALFKLGTGQVFDSKAMGQHVHTYFRQRQQDIGSASFKFMVVRDPIKRFLSAYSNRGIHHRELSKAFITPRARKWGLSLEDFVFDPDLDTFIEKFETYYKVGPIEHHTRPISTMVRDLHVFDKVYPMESLSQLEDDLTRITGQEFKLGRSQTGGPKIGIEQLSLEQLGKLFNFYREDYALLKDFYTMEDLLAEREKMLKKQ